MKQRIGKPATLPPGETYRKKRGGVYGKTASKQDNHATNPRAQRTVRRGERWLKRQQP